MITFLENIAERLLQKFPQNMDDVAIVFPSKRAVVFFKYYLSKKIKQPIFLPSFYSIEEFIEDLSGLQVLDNISLQFRLYKSYLKYPIKKQDTFDEFLKWSNILLHDFNEIDRNLVEAASIYNNLSNVKELESWSVKDWSFSKNDLTSMQSDYLSFFQEMLNWYNHFTQSLLEEKSAYQGLAYKQAARNITKKELKWKQIWFVGLNALTKSEQSIIDYLRQENIARVFWDADKFYYNNPLHEAGSFLRDQKDKWSEIDFKGIGDYYKQKKESFNIIACPKNISQAKVAGELIKSFSKDDLEDSNTAIVLADESLLYPVLHNLPSEVKQLNVTMGSPLKNTTLFAFIEFIFNMQINAHKYKKESFYYKDILKLIEHPYFIKIAESKQIEKFKNFIVENNIVFINQNDIKNIFTDDFVIEILTICNNASHIIKVFNRFVEHIKRFLVGKLASVESEVLSIFFQILVILKNLLDEYDFVYELKTLHVIMQELVAHEKIPFKGEPLKGVQLMGILESRTLDFKNVIMLSVNEGKIPKSKSVNSFIPYDLKKYFKLPTYSESEAVFSYHFFRLLQRASKINLLYNSETDDFGTGEKSRFISQLIAEYDGKIKEYVYKSTDLVFNSFNQVVIKNVGLEDKIRSWATKGVSPSALNIYNNCSLHFYYRYLVGMRINSEVDEYADASTMGTAIHNALDANYPLGVLTENYINNKTDLILLDIKQNFVQIFSKQAIKDGKNYLSLQIAQRLTKNFLKIEKEIILEANKNNEQINIIAKELELSYDLFVDGVNFKLIGKIDRVDLKGDTLRIIDYKTGNVDQGELSFTDFNELIDDPKKSKVFQLLMYSYLYLKNYPQHMGSNIVAGNFSFKNLKSGLLKVSHKITRAESKILIIDQNVLDNFEVQLKTVLSRINQNSFAQVPHLKNCEWCDNK